MKAVSHLCKTIQGIRGSWMERNEARLTSFYIGPLCVYHLPAVGKHWKQPFTKNGIGEDDVEH